MGFVRRHDDGYRPVERVALAVVLAVLASSRWERLAPVAAGVPHLTAPDRVALARELN